MPAISEEKNREHKCTSDQRRARAYNIVKLLAAREGYMNHQRDTDGLDRFMDSFHNDEIDWFDAIDDLKNKRR